MVSRSSQSLSYIPVASEAPSKLMLVISVEFVVACPSAVEFGGASIWLVVFVFVSVHIFVIGEENKNEFRTVLNSIKPCNIAWFSSGAGGGIFVGFGCRCCFGFGVSDRKGDCDFDFRAFVVDRFCFFRFEGGSSTTGSRSFSSSSSSFSTNIGRPGSATSERSCCLWPNDS